MGFVRTYATMSRRRGAKMISHRFVLFGYAPNQNKSACDLHGRCHDWTPDPSQQGMDDLEHRERLNECGLGTDSYERRPCACKERHEGGGYPRLDLSTDWHIRFDVRDGPQDSSQRRSRGGRRRHNT